MFVLSKKKPMNLHTAKLLKLIVLTALIGSGFCACSLAAPAPERGDLVFNSLPSADYHFTGVVGDRIQANTERWLLCAPQANPGMLGMFRVRDRQPVPQLVPWAGEFIGKYLISSIQALGLTNDPRLYQQVSNTVAAFIATQADDGYLGPFPKDTRLLKNWDLWGHYHAIYALLLWHERTGDSAALACARKAADLVCRTYLDTGRRVFDAGDPEMNMAILTGLTMLHRVTGEPRYLRMAREVEKDWERAGDYLRSGLDGREYFQSPRPRWESLHDLQGLVELWRVTGEPKYRDAFIHHWRSIRRWDRRNSGAFSSGEQATGNPYAPTAIETCCTVAWMALTIDYLKLTGDSRAADDLELSTLNGGLGAQHPSGRWWTYSTPMDGTREASAQTIVFQARAGTPELNCCSVNGPRVLGMLSEWVIQSMPGGLVVNSYLPGEFSISGDAARTTLVMDHDYPRANSQRILLRECSESEWTLRLRIPEWSRTTRLKTSFPLDLAQPVPGSYLDIRRRWKAGDEIALTFDFALRAVPGANEAAGKISLYRGPILLAWDQALNPFDADNIPALTQDHLNEAKLLPSASPLSAVEWRPWIQVEIPTAQAQALRLVDFASAGSAGTQYKTWLSPSQPMPPPAFTVHPRDGERLRPGSIHFQWRGPRSTSNQIFVVEVATNEAFQGTVSRTDITGSAHLIAPLTNSGPTTQYWWRVLTRNSSGITVPDAPPASFILDPTAPPQALPPVNKPGPNGELILHSLRARQVPAFGKLLSPPPQVGGHDGTRLNGRDQMLVYSLAAWPEDAFTVAVRFRIDELPTGRIGQIFSAWTGAMDDPLRLVVEKGKVFARIEAGQSFSTSGVAIEPNTWHHAVAVKEASTLNLYLDGKQIGSCPAPTFSTSASHECALGGNPRYSGNEFLAATLSDFALYERALSVAEIQQLAANQR